MTSKAEKNRRKGIVRELRQRELALAVAAMPITKEQLAALLQYVNAMVFAKAPDGRIRNRCDHTLRLTEGFLRPLGCWSEDTRAWLGQYGGYCDCEVVFNVGNYWEQHI